MDAQRIKDKPLVVTGENRKWVPKEREQLLIGVISENKRILFEKYSQEGDMAAIKALDSAPDSEMAMNTVGLDWGRISRLFVSDPFFYFILVSFYFMRCSAGSELIFFFLLSVFFDPSS